MLAHKKGQLQCSRPKVQVSGNDTACLGSFNRNKRPVLGKVNSKIELTKSSLIELGQSPPHQVVGAWTGLRPNVPHADHLG